MNIREEFEKETNKDYESEKSNNYPYLCGTGMYNDDYVEWLESKLKDNEVLDLVSDCEIDNLLSDLDKDATDYNGYEYGLPICGEWLVTLRTTVRTWLNK